MILTAWPGPAGSVSTTPSNCPRVCKVHIQLARAMCLGKKKCLHFSFFFSFFCEVHFSFNLRWTKISTLITPITLFLIHMWSQGPGLSCSIFFSFILRNMAIWAAASWPASGRCHLSPRQLFSSILSSKHLCCEQLNLTLSSATLFHILLGWSTNRNQ